MSELAHDVEVVAANEAADVAAVVAEGAAAEAVAELGAEVVEEIVEPLVELVEEAVEVLADTAIELEGASWESRLTTLMEETNARLARLESLSLSSSTLLEPVIPVSEVEPTVEAEVSETVEEIEAETGLELAQFDPLEVEASVPEEGSGRGRRVRGVGRRRST